MKKPECNKTQLMNYTDIIKPISGKIENILNFSVLLGKNTTISFMSAIFYVLLCKHFNI